MSSPPYMKLYVAEWTADTQHLTCEQDGAYGRLVRAMWRANGSLPSDPDKLARIVGLGADQWAVISGDVLDLFIVRAGSVTHKRLKKEVKKYRKTVKERAQSGKTGGIQSGINRRKRKAKSAEANASENRSNSSHNQNQTPIGEPLEGSPNRRRDAPLSLVSSEAAPTPERFEDRAVLKAQMAELSASLKRGKVA